MLISGKLLLFLPKNYDRKKSRYFTLNYFSLDWYIVNIFQRNGNFVETRAQVSEFSIWLSLLHETTTKPSVFIKPWVFIQSGKNNVIYKLYFKEDTIMNRPEGNIIATFPFSLRPGHWLRRQREKGSQKLE